MGSDFAEYGFEARMPKVRRFGKVGVGFAGNANYADSAFSMISKEMDLDDVVPLISQYIREEWEKIVDRFIHEHTGMEANEFFKLKNDTIIPEDIITLIYGYLADLEISFNSIVTGFDKNDKARIVVISGNGEVMDATFAGSYSIGEGGDFSIIYFDQKGYNVVEYSEAEAVYFAFEAKKWAEAPTSVGRKTDVIILRKDGTHRVIEEESDIMKFLCNTYNQERDMIKKHRKETCKEFEKMCVG